MDVEWSLSLVWQHFTTKEWSRKRTIWYWKNRLLSSGESQDVEKQNSVMQSEKRLERNLHFKRWNSSQWFCWKTSSPGDKDTDLFKMCRSIHTEDVYNTESVWALFLEIAKMVFGLFYQSLVIQWLNETNRGGRRYFKVIPDYRNLSPLPKVLHGWNWAIIRFVSF